MKIEIEIGELVLRGLAPARRRAVADAMRRELELRLAAPGLPGRDAGRPAPSAIARVDAGSVALASPADAASAGGAAGRAIGAALQGRLAADAAPGRKN